MAGLSKTPRGDERRAEILANVRDRFARNGFHATSMQDLLTATGLSAGAFYRYFPSKESIVTAVAESVLAEVSSAVLAGDWAHALPDLHEGMRRTLAAVERLEREQGVARLAMQFWAEGLRNPELAELLRDAFRSVLDWLENLIRTMQERGKLDPNASAPEVARVLMGFVHGFMIQHTLLGVSARVYEAGLGALEIGCGPREQRPAISCARSKPGMSGPRHR